MWGFYCIPDESLQESTDIFNKLSKPPLQLVTAIKMEKNTLLLFAYYFHPAIFQQSKTITNEERSFYAFLTSEN